SGFFNKISFAPGIHFMTPYELASIEKSMRQDAINLARSWNTQNHLNPKVSYDECIDNPIIDQAKPLVKNIIPLSINPNLPDSILKKQFDELLKSICLHEAKNNSSRYKKSDYKTWHNYGILPYLDLHLWSLEKS